MTDPLIAFGIAIVELFLTVVLSTRLVVEHMNATVPRGLTTVKGRGPRRNLILEIPVAIWFIGGGGLVVLLILLHPNSSSLVRLIAGLELVASAAWGAYLVRQISRSANS